MGGVSIIAGVSVWLPPGVWGKVTASPRLEQLAGLTERSDQAKASS
jgi:hypothetical protein